MQILVNLLKKHASGKVVMVCGLVTLLVFLVMSLYTFPTVEYFAPGFILFDLSLTGYSYEYALSLLNALGAEGRDVYRYLQLPVDFVFPVCLAISSALLLVWIFSKGFAPVAKIFYVSVLPFIGGFFDYLENISIARMIHSYPNVSNELVSASSAFTQLKTFFTVMAFLFLLVGIFRAFRNYLAINRSQS